MLLKYRPNRNRQHVLFLFARSATD